MPTPKSAQTYVVHSLNLHIFSSTVIPSKKKTVDPCHVLPDIIDVEIQKMII